MKKESLIVMRILYSTQFSYQMVFALSLLQILGLKNSTMALGVITVFYGHLNSALKQIMKETMMGNTLCLLKVG